MPDSDSNVRKVGQARASTTTLSTLLGKAGQWIIDKTTWRPHLMDGSTPGGHPVAMKSDVDTLDANVVKTTAQTLDEPKQTQVLDNLGVIQALNELIQENGGTVPTSLSENSVQTMSAQSADPWSEYD